MPNKIKIFDEPLVKESITYEEIQNEKKTQFFQTIINGLLIAT